ncbi:MAG: hypothetical protein WC763_06390 [Candidatus Paceibacterota bacterium]|jgi:hypothetical protein
MGSLETILSKLVDRQDSEVPRYRETTLSVDGYYVESRGRCGGGNRECWETYGKKRKSDGYSDSDDSDSDDDDRERDCQCVGCFITNVVPTMSHYISDEDWDVDCTYAIVKFRVPDRYVPLTRRLAAVMEPSVSTLKALMASLSGPISVKTLYDEADEHQRALAPPPLEGDTYESVLAELDAAVCAWDTRPVVVAVHFDGDVTAGSVTNLLSPDANDDVSGIIPDPAALNTDSIPTGESAAPTAAVSLLAVSPQQNPPLLHLQSASSTPLLTVPQLLMSSTS